MVAHGAKGQTDGYTMALDKATVQHIAKLARIRIEEDQLDPMAVELGRILDFIEQLGEVDTTGVPPMTGVAVQNLRRRQDVVSDGHYPDKVLANAPEATSGFFAVPKVVE